MTILEKLRRKIEDPPPAFAFEVSHKGIAWAYRGPTTELGFAPLDEGVLAISPLADNVVRPEALFEAMRSLTPANGKSRRRTAALILPDYCARVAVLDFDSFPSDRREQESLVRFRVKKSIPFDLDSARISYDIQSGGGTGKPCEVLVAVAALEIVARYEAALRAAGFAPGYVTTSTLAALRLLAGDGVRVIAKLGGGVLAVSVTQGADLKLLRCVELPELDRQEIMAVLQPTFAYIEDKMQAPPRSLAICGFQDRAGEVADECRRELGVEVEALRSRLGTPDDTNAGLLGYLEGAGT